MKYFEGPGADDLKRMIKHFPMTPGEEDLLRILGIKRKSPDLKKPDPKAKQPKDSLRKSGGGLSAAAKKIIADRKQAEQPYESTLEIFEFPTIEQPKPEEKVDEDPAIISDATWHRPDTLFHEEAEVSAKLTLPKGKEHITRIQVEIFAKTPSGPELISKGEGWAQADGTAIAKAPVYKPKGHDDGPVEYFFRVMHSLAKMVSTEMQPRTVSEMALKSADHTLISGVTFEKDSSFIGPKGTQALKPLEAKFNEWEKKYPKKAQIAVFGHTDKGEKDAKSLSERRAQSAFAFITNDAAMWDILYRAESWGLKALQTLLKDQGHYHGGLDGVDGPKTLAGFKAFQKGAGLPESGREDSATRKALFASYMKGKHDIKIDSSRFLKVAGHEWMGCATHNQLKVSEGAAPENRRVAFLLINPSKHFPVNFPCKDGNEEACQGQCKKKEKRSEPGIKCLFYDQMVREDKQAKAPEASTDDTATLTSAELKSVSGASDTLVELYQPHLNREMKSKGIDTPLKKAHFLAQLCTESGSFKYTEELASGSDYEGRGDLGNTESGDGKKFKGRGLIQITGRTNYTSFGTYCGEDFITGSNNKKVAEPNFSVLSAIWYWSSRNLNPKAENDEFLDICYRVNGGFNGLKERAVYLKKGYEVFKISDGNERLEKIIATISKNLDKVLPLVNAALDADPELNAKLAAKKLAKEKKITHFEKMLFTSMDSETKIKELKVALKI
jgi:predicted chitinase/outer membrane protein OmpA-like peptidoglycan-associated protein